MHWKSNSTTSPHLSGCIDFTYISIRCLSQFFSRDAFEIIQRWSEKGQFFLIFRWQIIKCFLFLHLSPCGSWWCGVLGFVPAGFVSSPSTLQIFQEAVHLLWFFCPPVYLLGQFPWLVHIQDSTVTCWICKHKKMFKKKCRTCQNVNGKALYLYWQFPTSIFSSCRKHWCISSDRLRGWWVVAMTTTGYCFCCDISSVMFR